MKGKNREALVCDPGCTGQTRLNSKYISMFSSEVEALSGELPVIVKWNLTRKLKSIKGSDVLVLSIGKSGRTWLRVLINKYISLTHDIPLSLNDMSIGNDNIPSILYTHEQWAHLCNATFRQRILGRYIVPDRILATKRVVVLYRDPRDVLVSLYFQSRRGNKRKFKDDSALMDLVGGSKDRFSKMIQVLNNWRRRLAQHPQCLWISYEELMADTPGKFMEVLRHVGFGVPDEKLVSQAIEFSKFENMKKMEAENHFDSRILRPGDPNDPDSFKVRKGEVGGYVNYFSEDELTILEKSLVKLDPFYGYNGAHV